MGHKLPGRSAARLILLRPSVWHRPLDPCRNDVDNLEHLEDQLLQVLGVVNRYGFPRLWMRTRVTGDSNMINPFGLRLVEEAVGHHLLDILAQVLVDLRLRCITSLVLYHKRQCGAEHDDSCMGA